MTHNIARATDSQNTWTVVTHALLVGFVAWNALLWIAIELGRHSQQFPTGTAQPVAWVVAVGIIGSLLLRRGVNAGYWLTILTAMLGIVSMALIAVGPHGPPPGDPAVPILFVVFGPGGYVGFAVILIGTTLLGWRGRGDAGERDSGQQAPP